MPENESVTDWIEQLQEGQAGTVQQEVWDRYFQRLVVIARERLKGSPCGERDEEDAVLSAFDTFFIRIQRGEFPNLQDRTGLWPLLIKITIRKALNQRRRAYAQKRRALGESALAGEGEDDQRWIEQFARQEPSPEVLVEATEQANRLMGMLTDDSLREVAEMKLEGSTNREIAQRIGVIERTIERRLVHIRKLWSEAEA